VLGRLDGLPANARTLAGAVAVFGTGVELRVAAEVAEIPVSAASQAAGQLMAAALLEPDYPLRYVHALVRAAVYGYLRTPQRAELHDRAARALTADNHPIERVAAHVLLSAPRNDADVVDQLRRAAAEASARGSLAAACAYLRRALAEPPPVGLRAQVLLELAAAEAAAADPAAAARLPAAFAAASDPSMRALAFEHAAWFLLASGRTEETLGMLNTVQAELSGDSNRELELEAQFVAAAMLDPRAIEPALERMAAVGEDLAGTSAGERMMLCHLAYHRMWRSEDADRAVDLARRALSDGRLLRERGVQPHELTGPIMALTCADELDQAAGVIDEAQAIAVERGSEHLFAFLSCMRAIHAFRAGNLAEAEAEAQTSVEITLRSGLLLGAAVGAGWLIWTLVDRGELETAQEVLDRVSPDGQVAVHAPFSILLAARGRLRLADGHTEQGTADLLECGRRNAVFGIRNPIFVPWRPEAVSGLLRLGRLEQARAVAEDEVASAAAWGTPASIGSAHRVRAMVAGDHDAAIAELSEAEMLLRRTPVRLELARVLLDLGSALRRSGQRIAARDHLRDALDVATRCGAVTVANAAKEELRTAGARPRRTAVTGVDALTPAETRVANLAGSGLSATEIAQRLFLSKRTVETHLQHIYTKLGISSRDQLATHVGQ
jgi:DNA-binding CsgD family transcriptional regulator/phosphohistidine swiveling domain-containing protein